MDYSWPPVACVATSQRNAGTKKPSAEKPTTKKPSAEKPSSSAASTSKLVIARAKYNRLKQKWLLQLPLPGGRQGSWLTSRLRDGRWGVGCKVCAAHASSGSHRSDTYANFTIATSHDIQLIKFRRHQSTERHRQACAAWTRETFEPSSVRPRKEEFTNTLKHRLSGASLRSGIATAGPEKLRRIMFCLAEAKRHMYRERMKSATSIALHTDGRGPRLLVNWHQGPG